MDIVSRMIKEWSKEPATLNKTRAEMLFNPKDGLKLRTEGYQWLKSNGSADKIICVKPDNKYTVSEEFGLGKVDNIWVVASSSNRMEGSLKEMAKERIKMRGNPNFVSYSHYKKVRSSCWIVEEVGGNFYCDCPKGMKGKQCWHEVGLMYKKGKLEVTSEVRSVPINQKRKRGRPKKLPHCLTRSPTAAAAPEVSTDQVLPEPVPEDEYDDPEELIAQAEPVLRKTSRKRKRLLKDQQDQGEQQSPVVALLSQSKSLQPGLGTSKPPKKKARNETQKDSQAQTSTQKDSQTKKPQALKCKKKVGTCNHEVVFGEHYDRKAWNIYADYVRAQKSSVEIDPNYVV